MDTNSNNGGGGLVKIITGAAGFLGSNVFARIGESTLAYDDLSFGCIENIWRGGITFECGFETLTQSMLDEADILIHCATANIIFAQTEPQKTFDINAVKTLDLFRKFKGKIVYTSTSSVYGDSTEIPTTEAAEIRLSNAYDSSKYIAEQFLKQRGNYTTLRLSNVYGVNQRPENPYCGVVGRLVYQHLTGNKLTVIGSGEQTRDFTYADDVVDAIELAVNLPAQDTEINIATGIETSIAQLASMISPNYETGFIERKIDIISRRCLSIEKAERLLGWKPKTDLKTGLEKTIQWQKSI